jgi:hypothetical protein
MRKRLRVAFLAAAAALSACGGPKSPGTTAAPSTVGTPAPAAASSVASAPGSGAKPAAGVRVNDGGFPYVVTVSALRLAPEIPGGAQSAPPGSDFVVADVEIANPLTDRSEPVTPFDQGDTGTDVVLSAPADATQFGCSPASPAASPGEPDSPPGCVQDLYVVSDSLPIGEGQIPPGSSITISIAYPQPVPAGTDLSRAALYFNDQIAQPPEVVKLSP